MKLKDGVIRAFLIQFINNSIETYHIIFENYTRQNSRQHHANKHGDYHLLDILNSKKTAKVGNMNLGHGD